MIIDKRAYCTCFQGNKVSFQSHVTVDGWLHRACCFSRNSVILSKNSSEEASSCSSQGYRSEHLFLLYSSKVFSIMSLCLFSFVGSSSCKRTFISIRKQSKNLNVQFSISSVFGVYKLALERWNKSLVSLSWTAVWRSVSACISWPSATGNRALRQLWVQRAFHVILKAPRVTSTSSSSHWF